MDLLEAAIFVNFNFLSLEGFEDTFNPVIILRTAISVDTERKAGFLQSFNISSAGYWACDPGDNKAGKMGKIIVNFSYSYLLEYLSIIWYNYSYRKA
ncbi:MAG TPA: hypothetical protein VM123_18175 [archaeon]|nr:hypothetical protein [archaeon]